MCGLTVLLSPLSSFGWSQKGHDVVAHIAERHLTPKTAAAVDSLLKGQTMVYWANWLDNASHTPEYEYSRTWHYKNIDPQETFENANVNPKGDILKALSGQAAVLTNSATSNEPDASLALKMVIHLMGDLHQPMHMGRYSDRGGNNHQTNFFDKKTNLHSIWDSFLVESGHKWSYTEWADQIDRTSDELLSYLIAGDYADWGKESYEIAKEIYAGTPEESTVTYDYIAKWTPVIEQQLLKGGIRLAHILNGIFDPDYNKGLSKK